MADHKTSDAVRTHTDNNKSNVQREAVERATDSVVTQAEISGDENKKTAAVNDTKTASVNDRAATDANSNNKAATAINDSNEAATAVNNSEKKIVTIAGHAMTASDIFKFVGLIIFFVLMIVVCVLLWPYVMELFEPGGYQNVIESVQNAGPVGVAILLVFQFIQIVVAFIPGEIVQIVAGLVYGPWGGALIIWVGCIVSSAFIFLLVHKLGAPFVQAMVPDKYMDKFRSFEESGRLNIVVFILFLVPAMPKDIFTYITPLTHMKMRTFLLLTNLGRIPGIVMSTFAAAGLVEGHIVRSIIIFVIVAAIAIAVLLSYERIMKYLERRFGRNDLDMNAIDTSSDKSKKINEETAKKSEGKPQDESKGKLKEKTVEKSNSTSEQPEPSAES